MAVNYWARMKAFVSLTTQKIYRKDLLCFSLILLCVSQKEINPSIRTHLVGSHVSSLIFKNKDSDKIKCAVCLLHCHKPFFEAVTVSIRSTKCMLAGMSCVRWHITGLKSRQFSNCYFPLLLGFLNPLTLEAEMLRNCCEWHCHQSSFQSGTFHCSLVSWILWHWRQKCSEIVVNGTAWQYMEKPFKRETMHQPLSSPRIRVVSSTCQPQALKRQEDLVVLGVSKCFMAFSSLGNTQKLQRTLFFLKCHILLRILYWLTSTHGTPFPLWSKPLWVISHGVWSGMLILAFYYFWFALATMQGKLKHLLKFHHLQHTEVPPKWVWPFFC